jgi:hypothetical protein
MRTIYALISSALVLLGCVFVADSFRSSDNLAVIAASAGWAGAMTGLLHLLVALGRHGGEAVRWLAVASGLKSVPWCSSRPQPSSPRSGGIRLTMMPVKHSLGADGPSCHVPG